MGLCMLSPFLMVCVAKKLNLCHTTPVVTPMLLGKVQTLGFVSCPLEGLLSWNFKKLLVIEVASHCWFWNGETPRFDHALTARWGILIQDSTKLWAPLYPSQHPPHWVWGQYADVSLSFMFFTFPNYGPDCAYWKFQLNTFFCSHSLVYAAQQLFFSC